MLHLLVCMTVKEEGKGGDERSRERVKSLCTADAATDIAIARNEIEIEIHQVGTVTANLYSSLDFNLK